MCTELDSENDGRETLEVEFEVGEDRVWSLCW